MIQRISFLIALFFIIFLQLPVFSQSSLKAVIVNDKDGKPVSYASVSVPKKKIGILTDSKGFFLLPVLHVTKTDSIYISSIGFQTLGFTFLEAMKISEFHLKEATRDMENVVIRSYSYEAAEGSKSEVAGYFRCWPIKSRGAEIGKMFTINQADYKVEKIRFKVNNQCEACQIRVRIREVKGGLPAKLLLLDSISMPVKKLGFDDKYSEFDFSSKNLVLNTQEIFISLEVLNCSNSGTQCSLCFIGTEPGSYFYKNYVEDYWQESNLHSIYLKLYYKY